MSHIYVGAICNIYVVLVREASGYKLSLKAKKARQLKICIWLSHLPVGIFHSLYCQLIITHYHI